MTEHDIERIACRVVELLREEPVAAKKSQPLTVAQVAKRFGRSPDWVRSHRHRLGVLPVEGPRPRLLFDAAKVEAAATAQSPTPKPTKPQAPCRPRRRSQPERELLPIAGRS